MAWDLDFERHGLLLKIIKEVKRTPQELKKEGYEREARVLEDSIRMLYANYKEIEENYNEVFRKLSRDRTELCKFCAKIEALGDLINSFPTYNNPNLVEDFLADIDMSYDEDFIREQEFYVNILQRLARLFSQYGLITLYKDPTNDTVRLAEGGEGNSLFILYELARELCKKYGYR